MATNKDDVSAIRSVCDLVEREYVTRLGAPDQFTAERWQSDSAVRFREGYKIRLLRDEHRDLVNAAIHQWEDRESTLLRLFDGSRDIYLDWFETLYETIWRDRMIPLRTWKDRNDVYNATELSRMVTVNINWCQTFGIFLPAACPDNRIVLSRIGMAMSATFYLERIAKARDRFVARDMQGMSDQSPLKITRLEAIDSVWRRAVELSKE